MSCAILNQLAPPSRLYWSIRWSLCFMLVRSHLISWTLPINQTSPPFGWVMVSGGAYCPQYLPPVLNSPRPPTPPRTIISLPVQTAVCSRRASGALMVLVTAQLFVGGLYLPPVFKEVHPPPQMIISLPVHTAV